MKNSVMIEISVFILLLGLGFTKCFSPDNDPLFKKEVEDFEEWLREKVVKDTLADENHPKEDVVAVSNLKDTNENSKENVYDDYSEPNSENFEFALEELSTNEPSFGKIEYHISDEGTASMESVTSDTLSNIKMVDSYIIPEKHHGVEEILFIRRSDSDLNDPIPEIMERLIRNVPAIKDESINIHPPVPHSNKSVASDAQDSHLADICPNFSSNDGQICSTGPEYEMRFHSKYAERLKMDMEQMLPKKDHKDSKCNYHKRLGRDKGVEDRALCPFEWTISNHNPSRVPEYLFEAKCSCQVSRKVHDKRYECQPIKRVIPVLWLVECHGGKRKHKLGWEEIAVACVPIEERREKDESKLLDLHSPI